MKKLYLILYIFIFVLSSQVLMAKSNHVVQLTANNTLSTLIRSKKPVLIKFWAPWCKPCKKMTPKYKAAAQKFTDKVLFAEVNIAKYKSVGYKYRVKSIPTLILFKDNKIIKRTTGSLSQKAIENFVRTGL